MLYLLSIKITQFQNKKSRQKRDFQYFIKIMIRIILFL